MSVLMRAISADPWAIVEADLFKIAAIAARRELPEGEKAEWVRRDHQIVAGPSAQKLPGSRGSFFVDGVAVIQMFGPIFPRANMMTEHSGATSISTLSGDFQVAMSNSEVGAILIQADTPGGAVAGIAAFADQLHAGMKKKKVVVHVSGAAASAGYWIATQASEIVLDRTALVGSIGVVTAVPVQVAPDAEGNQWIEVVSSNAPNKRPVPVSEEGLAEIQGTLNAIERSFVADVARGRKVSVETVRAEFGQGGVKVGADAVKAGMADRVASYEATLNALVREVSQDRRLAQLRR